MAAAPQPLPDAGAAGLARVLAAVVYDALLTLAILFVATALALFATGGEAIAPGSGAYRAYLICAAFPYFGWCWTHGGQTLGMRAWGLRLERADGTAPRLREAMMRYVAALLSWLAAGAGFAWILVDRDRRSWHDRLSGTRIVVVSRRERRR